jgi:hypothetical protein
MCHEPSGNTGGFFFLSIELLDRRHRGIELPRDSSGYAHMFELLWPIGRDELSLGDARDINHVGLIATKNVVMRSVLGYIEADVPTTLSPEDHDATKTRFIKHFAKIAP